MARRSLPTKVACRLIRHQSDCTETCLQHAEGRLRRSHVFLDVLSIGVTRIGLTATEWILEDFQARKAVLSAASPTFRV